MKKIEYETIVCIVNAGFSETVMDNAKAAGAKGGTIINARGTANKESETIFNVTIQPEKEMVLIVVPSEIKEKVMHEVYKTVGQNTDGQGITFSLPVDEVLGIK